MINILNQFSEFLDKQDMLNKLSESSKLNDYGYSEIHTIRSIGNLENPNVTEIAKTLKMTRGAISKITKKLLSNGVIEVYRLLDNKRKIFFKLTVTGNVLYEEHEKRHKLWMDRDCKFLKQFSSEKLEQISEFMLSYNDYLEQQIKELNENRRS